MSEPKTYLERHLEKKRNRLERGAEYRSYMVWAGRALEVPLSIVVGLMLGVVLDRWLGIAPWGTVFGIVVGIATGVRFAYRLNRSYQAQHGGDDEPKPDANADAEMNGNADANANANGSTR